MGEIEGTFKLFGRTIQLATEGVCPEKATVDAKKMDQRKEEESALSTAAAPPPTRPESKNLPCPRCRSGDTKFCYYNNYNANQPRHFCRNCQRYWTAGGAMRNVPVGAGRRKSKSSVARAVAVGDDVVTGTVLSFSGGRIADARAAVCGWMGGERDEYSCGSSVTGSSSMEEAGNCAVYPFLSGNYWAGNWLAPPPQLSPPATTTTARTRSLEFGLSSPPGKRSSIGDLKERRGSIPESLRIDDQAEAARSYVGLRGVFQPKKESKWQAMAESNRVVSSNPAALSRSINFQEMV